MIDDAARILLVEDNPGDARLFREMLIHSGSAISLGWEVDVRSRLDEALAALDAGGYALVLLDLSLPDSKGIDSFRHLHARHPGVPVVVLTGTDDSQFALHAVQHGAQDYLAKDHADSYTLVRAVRYALERTRAEKAERQRHSLQEALAAMDEVLAIVSHELRTPLSAQQLVCELLLTETLPHPEQRRYLGMMSEEVNRMIQTISTILDAARLHSGAVRWNWSNVDVTALCAEALQVVRPLVNASAVNLLMRIEPPDLAFRGDAGAVRRLLVNLLGNAIRYTDEGQIELLAEEVVCDGGRCIRLSVVDTGEGIPDEIIARLGVAFAINSGPPGDSHRKHGTGLGLTICKCIAAAHGGTISFKSTPGQGSTFLATLQADLVAPSKVPPVLDIARETAA